MIIYLPISNKSRDFQVCSLSFRSSAAMECKAWGEGPAVKPRSPFVSAEHPLFPQMNVPCCQTGIAFPAFRLLLEFQQAEALRGIVFSGALLLSLRLADSLWEVWDMAALKGVTHCSSFVCSLARFCCTASPRALIIFSTELVRRV